MTVNEKLERLIRAAGPKGLLPHEAAAKMGWPVGWIAIHVSQIRKTLQATGEYIPYLHTGGGDRYRIATGINAEAIAADSEQRLYARTTVAELAHHYELLYADYTVKGDAATALVYKNRAGDLRRAEALL